VACYFLFELTEQESWEQTSAEQSQSRGDEGKPKHPYRDPKSRRTGTVVVVVVVVGGVSGFSHWQLVQSALQIPPAAWHVESLQRSAVQEQLLVAREKQPNPVVGVTDPPLSWASTHDDCSAKKVAVTIAKIFMVF
jgi:cytochrome c-type biogenesis protein CcmH/NrfG